MEPAPPLLTLPRPLEALRRVAAEVIAVSIHPFMTIGRQMNKLKLKRVPHKEATGNKPKQVNVFLFCLKAIYSPSESFLTRCDHGIRSQNLCPHGRCSRLRWTLEIVLGPGQERRYQAGYFIPAAADRRL